MEQIVALDVVEEDHECQDLQTFELSQTSKTPKPGAQREKFLALMKRRDVHSRHQIDNATRISKALVQAGRNINLGYGIHFGWAIEGAIGSNLKIDASYLSPHGMVALFK